MVALRLWTLVHPAPPLRKIFAPRAHPKCNHEDTLTAGETPALRFTFR
jgi:hypothetical protein